ncbi:uroporphyrinogen decarboxylase [Wenzhouxiangella marina]|uniref:Uroporphyrinogen decarboxylase n=1 Tax=Wenzhouxiangella marina TaxID=1579979 RepID=A0A0K0XSR4_9GAMM|nr:uroporphyrinogen decarboxylase [Wenzhouxiangella marina]AKS40677.1 uroporphyrinogen decarboxylase [Wenzhouxiangella marina]MBB6088447.1 uroporphyrinogen decarboxylase [Wenzhouxiangella marina]
MTSSSSIKDSLFMKALRREPTERRPMWLMRQAGRYLPEYRATRAKAGSFLKLAGNPELACEVTLQPIERYGFDAAILFSDILILPHAMGLGLGFQAGEGPYFERPVRTPDDVAALPTPDPKDDTGYVMEAVRLIRRDLPEGTPLIGFAGSPWTVATYMIEGRSSKDFANAKKLLLGAPEAAHQLMNHLADTTADYLAAQVEAGADALMIFDSWGGALSPTLYRDYSLASQQRIVDRLKERCPDTPLILFGKGCGQHLELLADTGCQGLGVDWTMDLSEARERVGHRVALQGNLDPAVLLTSPEIIQAETRRVLDSFGDGPGHIFNLGHGITPEVPPEHVEVLVETVRSRTF